MYIPVDLWFRAFLLTVVVEAPVSAFLLRRFEPSRARLLVLVLFANLASHPAVWFVFSQLLDLGSSTFLLVAEGWAVAIEALFYWAAFRGLPVHRAIAISFTANVASFIVGQVATASLPSLFA